VSGGLATVRLAESNGEHPANHDLHFNVTGALLSANPPEVVCTRDEHERVCRPDTPTCSAP